MPVDGAGPAALADRVEIAELISRYAAAVDDRNFSRVVGFFTEDGVLSRPPWGAKGRDELDAAYRAALGRYEWTFHAIHGHAVDLDPANPDEASGFVTCHAEHALNGEVVQVAIRYRDRYRRVDGAWRFAAREIGFAYAYAVPGSGPIAVRGSSVRWPGEEAAAYSVAPLD